MIDVGREREKERERERERDVLFLSMSIANFEQVFDEEVGGGK